MCFEEINRGASGSPLLFPVPDPQDPNKLHIVRGSVNGIHALETLLKQRFQDGHELGLAQGRDRLEQVEGALRALLQKLGAKP